MLKDVLIIYKNAIKSKIADKKSKKISNGKNQTLWSNCNMTVFAEEFQKYDTESTDVNQL